MAEKLCAWAKIARGAASKSNLLGGGVGRRGAFPSRGPFPEKWPYCEVLGGMMKLFHAGP